MKKIGFTLAEMLITLGVIGIVSALTIPSLITNNMEAQVGPKLAKVVATFEQANANLLSAMEVDSLSDTKLLDSTDNYINELSRYLKLLNYGNDVYMTKDGIYYAFIISTPRPANTEDSISDQRLGSLVVALDNSALDGNGVFGSNTFSFSLWNDGSLRPTGATNWNGEETSKDGGAFHWKTKCPVGKAPEATGDYEYCTGHIFENNLKILYK